MRVGHRTGRQAALVLGLGLIAAGCSVGEPPAAAPPLPPPARELVVWSDSVCTTIKSLDGLQAQVGSVNGIANDPYLVATVQSYLVQVASGVENARQALTTLPPAGIEAADAYIASLVGALDGVRRQLPQAGDATITTIPDDQKLARTRQVADMIATLKPEGPKLAGLAERDPKLVASYNLAPNCDPVKQAGELAEPVPNRALVLWSNTMCTSTKSLAGLQKDPVDSPVFRDPRFAQFADLELSGYLSSAQGQVSSVEQQLAVLAPTGIEEADRYRESLHANIQTALEKLPQDGMTSLYSLPSDQLAAQAKQVADTLATINPPGSDLPTIAAHRPELAASYNLAPNCEPLQPPGSTTAATLPPATNGTDVGACLGGRCQVQISAPVDITVSGIEFSVSVSSTGVAVVNDSAAMQLGPEGTGQYGEAGKTVNFRVIGLTATDAVLDISTS
jgi:hypothetical protein